MRQNRAKRSLVVGVLLLMGACTERNKDFCGDGTCIDPGKPFCDLDGTVAGNPGTCIAVSCTAGEFETCRGDQAVTCNASGTNFDVTTCSLGCDGNAHGCKQCTTSAQCSEAAPICDAMTSSCRTCKLDDECPSKVCDAAAGRCIAETSIVYTSSDAIAGSCSLSQPCPLSKAIVTAANAPGTPLVRMLPGTYGPLLVDVPTPKPLEIVGTGATILTNAAAVTSQFGASIVLRDLTQIIGGIACGRDNINDPHSTMAIRRSKVAGDVAAIGCDLTVVDSDMASNVAVQRNASFTADRVRMHNGTTQVSLIAFEATSTIKVTNSVIERLGLFRDSLGKITFAFDTFSVDQTPHGVTADGCPPILFENCVSQVIAGLVDPFPNASCTLTNTIASTNSVSLPGLTIADPQLVDVANKDFHLRSTSPARDAATNATIASDHDLEGVPRPQGAKADIGAFEFH